jgi:hypothetical protein
MNDIAHSFTTLALTQKAFLVFEALMARRQMAAMFSRGMRYFMQCMHVLDCILQQLIPSLHKHMQVR